MQCSIHCPIHQFPPPPPHQDFNGPFRLRFSPRLILEHTHIPVCNFLAPPSPMTVSVWREFDTVFMITPGYLLRARLGSNICTIHFEHLPQFLNEIVSSEMNVFKTTVYWQLHKRGELELYTSSNLLTDCIYRHSIRTDITHHDNV